MVFPFPHPFLGHVSCVPFVHISSFHCFPSLLFLFHPTPPPFLILRAFPSICSFLSFPFPCSIATHIKHHPKHNLPEKKTRKATELAMQHTIRSQICHTICFL